MESVIRNTSHVLDVAVMLRGAAPSCCLCAYVVPAHEFSKVKAKALIEYLKVLMMKHLPSYSIPSIIEDIEALPLTTNKKLDVGALSHLRSKHDISSGYIDNTYLTPLEKQIAEALLEALDLPADYAVSPGTTYSQLGGNSLQAFMVLRHLNQSIGSKIHLSQFFRKDISIRHLANVAFGEQRSKADSSSGDLLEYKFLPLDIAYNVRRPSIRRQKKILLTGSTGFLGSHLLAEILSTGCHKVSYIVRASDESIARKRVKFALQNWDLWKDSFESSFDVYCGDLSQPFLGLSINEYLDLAQQVDTVYHSAAAVSFIAPFTELKDANITSTIEILRFASTLTQKRLTYISTLSVFFDVDSDRDRGLETSVRVQHTGIITGYAQTKWASEQLVLEFVRLGGHALILRPGRLLGNTRNYKCPRDDFTISLISSVLELGVAPNLDDVGGKNWQIDLTPVDFCARVTCQLSQQGEVGIRHIINKNTVSFESIIDSLGNHLIKRMPYRQ